jgi:uncharacterized protein (DUF885 family)
VDGEQRVGVALFDGEQHGDRLAESGGAGASFVPDASLTAAAAAANHPGLDQGSFRLHRRAFLFTSAAAFGGAALPAFAQPGAEPQARRIYDALAEAVFRASPQTATSLGVDTGPRAWARRRLDDRSYANRLNLLGPCVEARPRLAGVARAALQGRARSDYDAVKWMADISAEIAGFAYGGVDSYGYPVPYVISQLTGAYQSTPDFLDSQHPIETRDDAEAYLDRLAHFPKVLDEDTGRSAADAGRDVIPPDFIIESTLSQLRDLRGQRGESSNLAASLARRTREKGVAGDWGARAARIVDGHVAAALDRQIAHMEQLRRRAAHRAGVRGLPRGEDYYRMCLRFQTSTRMSPEEAHQLGLRQVAELHAQAEPLLRAEGLTQGGVGARLTALGKDPRHLYPNTDAGRTQLLADLNRQVEAVRARMPEVFATLPKAAVEVRRVPPSIELGAPRGYAQSGSIDGSRPGAYYINLKDTGIWPKWALPTLTYHESLPGHHLQNTLVLEAEGTPMLFKLLGFNAYGEGWGLYAEQLADEIGMYRDYPLGRLGFLQSLLYRAARIVLDTGIHWHGWSRERAIAYFIETVGLAPDAARSEVDRYCVWPGQACGYKIGHNEFVRIRDKARAALGPRFDLKAFHDVVLLGGAVPLEVLERVVDEWAASQTARAA